MQAIISNPSIGSFMCRLVVFHSNKDCFQEIRDLGYGIGLGLGLGHCLLSVASTVIARTRIVQSLFRVIYHDCQV